jgi:HD-like signal output (HDOD) protein
LEAESLLLDVNHGELGGLIAQNWNLPPRVVQGITYHHNPAQGMDGICYLTYLANQLAKRIEAGLDGRAYEVDLPQEVAEYLSVTPEMLNALYPLAATRYAEVSRRYNAV